MTDLETALREQIKLAVTAQIALDVVTDHCHRVLEKFRDDLDEEVSPEVQAIIEANDPVSVVPGTQLTPGQEMYATHLEKWKSVGQLDIDIQPTQLPFVRPGSEVPLCGVQYEGDTLMNTGHTAVIRYE